MIKILVILGCILAVVIQFYVYLSKKFREKDPGYLYLDQYFAFKHLQIIIILLLILIALVLRTMTLE